MSPNPYIGSAAQRARAENIKFLEKMVREGIEVNGWGLQRFDGSTKNDLLLNLMYIRGASEKAANDYLEVLIKLKRLIIVDDPKYGKRVFLPESDSPLLKHLQLHK